MEWSVYQGDILEVPADVLVCPANVFLTLSGGVGGAFALKYGYEVQQQLQQYLCQRGVRHVSHGDVVTTDGGKSPYRWILHAVAVDGFYDTNQQVIASVIARSLHRAAELCAQSVALSALATGYGRKSMEYFGAALQQAWQVHCPPIKRVTVALRKKDDVDALVSQVPQLSRYQSIPE